MSLISIICLPVTLPFALCGLCAVKLNYGYRQDEGRPVPPKIASLGPDTFKGKTALIVGGTRGIGEATVRALSKYGVTSVVAAGRSSAPSLEGGVVRGATVLTLDVTSVKDCEAFVRQRLGDTKFDLVLFTSADKATRRIRRTVEGLDECLVVGYLSRFVLIHELVKNDKLAPGASVFTLGNVRVRKRPIHTDDLNSDRFPYSRRLAHLRINICNQALAMEMARRFPNYHFFWLNPGFVEAETPPPNPNGRRRRRGRGGGRANAAGMVMRCFSLSPSQYVEKTLVHLLGMSSRDAERSNGALFDISGVPVLTTGQAGDAGEREAIWAQSVALVRRGDPSWSPATSEPRIGVAVVVEEGNGALMKS